MWLSIRSSVIILGMSSALEAVQTSLSSHPWVILSERESESESHSVAFDSLQPHGLYSPWNSEVGSLSLLQGIFSTQGSNSGLPHCRQILNRLSYQESPRILEWVAYPFSKRTSPPRDRSGVSCIAGRFFTS